MKSFSIEDIKTFMNDLLVNERYDSFYLFEARIKTGLDYYIRGKINKEFFDYDIKDSLEEYELWGNVKETVFSLMKGKRLPVSFKIILMFNNENVERLIEMNNLPVAPTDITGLFVSSSAFAKFGVTIDKAIINAVTKANIFFNFGFIFNLSLSFFILNLLFI